jgi:hypothetical protein
MLISDVLKQREYATAVYGKWHLGHHEQFLPLQHGFDEYFGLPYSNDMWPKHPTAKNFPDLPLIHRHKTIEYNPDQTLLTTWYTERNFYDADQAAAVIVPDSLPWDAGTIIEPLTSVLRSVLVNPPRPGDVCWWFTSSEAGLGTQPNLGRIQIASASARSFLPRLT